MEAVPRLPMVSFEMLICTKKISFTNKIEKYITGYYHEDASTYHTEIQALDTLRISAVWPSNDINSCQAMKKYFCQLHYMKSRFPMDANQPVSLQFSWRDEYTKMSSTVPDVGFEEMCVLFNIGALHSKLGATDSRSTPDGMKMACTHFQCAAWTYQVIREQYAQYVGVIIANIDIVRAMELLCLAQAQECILEKCLLDNRKAAVVIKVAAELSNFYFKAHKLLVSGDDAMLYEHLPQNKYLVRYVQFKIAHYRCVSLLYAGQQAEEQQKMGTRVAYYQAAHDALEEARGCIDRMAGGSEQPALFTDTITFTWDVVEAKRKAAVNENEFIYHEEVPRVTGPGFELQGASLVKGIPFSVTDVEISGPDIFARLIPMVAHEASSIYSEQKASLLRYVADEIEKTDYQLQEFMSAINVDFLTQIKSATGLTQELVDRAADMHARPESVKKLVEMMSKLSDVFHEVESLLSEIQDLLQNEDQAEAKFQSIMGIRPQSNVLIELRREAVKYQEAHKRASESNEALHKAMTSHVANLKILAQPLNRLQEEIPSIILPDSNIDEEALTKLEMVLAKVDEMKTQRATLWKEFRDKMHTDDITPLLVTTDLDMDDLFKMEMKKHKKIAEVIKQNVGAQENIKSALTKSYAALNHSRKYIDKILRKRHVTISALITSYDTYDDLQAKAQRGIEFYTKLENNVTKLCQRVRSTCNVQQEEREQLLITTGILLKNSDSSYPTDHTSFQSNDQSSKKTPRLKDYLDTRTTAIKNETSGLIHGNYIYSSGLYPPGDRPTPVGADSVTIQSASTYETSLNTIPDEFNSNLASDMKQLTVAQPYSQDSSSICITSGYDNNHGIINRYNSLVTTIAGTYDLSNMSRSTYVQKQDGITTNIGINIHEMPTLKNTSEVQGVKPPYDRKTEIKSCPYNSSTSGLNTAQMSLNNNTNITDLSRYYNTADRMGTVETPMTIPTQLQNQFKEKINFHCNSSPIVEPNNQKPVMNNTNQYHAYTTGYTQCNIAKTDPPFVSVSSDVTGNDYNSTNYACAYASYNTQQANDLSAFSPHANYNCSVVQQGVPYNSTSSGLNNYPSTFYLNGTQSKNLELNESYDSSSSINRCNQIQSNNITSISCIPVTQAIQYDTSLTYNSADLPWTSTSTQTTTVASTARNQNYMPFGLIGESVQDYTSAQYGNLDVTPIKSHVSNHSNADSVNFYGQQASSNYGSHNVCQTTGYNNSHGHIQPEHGKMSVLTENSIAISEQKLQDSYHKSTPQKVIQDLEKVNNIDLLAGLDFSINQSPLIPKKELLKNQNNSKTQSTSSPIINVTSKIELANVAMSNKKTNDKPIKKEPFRTAAVVTQFTNLALEFCVLTDSLVVDKTLNTFWKEVQDAQDSITASNMSISVARCYPLKNRYPDILPYDYSRIELIEAKDDYINASKVYDLHEYVPNFIITQNPLKSTMTDFWDMIWERNVETVVCLLSDNEIGGDVYWPTLQTNDLNIGNKVITLQNTHVRSYSTELRIYIHIPEKREIKYISLYQFTSWTGSLVPANAEAFLTFAYDVFAEYDTQISHLNPILVHCNSGVGRSGCFCTVMSTMGEVNSTGKGADVKQIISLISAKRKNILRDREHLKFTYNTIALFYKDLIKAYNSSAIENLESIIVKENLQSETTKVDPLSSIDPLWSTKK